MKDSFSKYDSAAIKGIAICMMLFHHCFLSGRFDDYSVIFAPFSQTQIVHMASFFKICVSLFAFVSGYGLYISYKNNSKSTSVWLKERLIRLLSGYCFIVILSWITCWSIDPAYLESIYFSSQNIIVGLLRLIIEFFGLSNFFGVTLLNGDWWYISAAIIFVLITPFMMKIFKSFGSGYALILCIIFPSLFDFQGGTHWLSFLLPYCFGLFFAENNLFYKIEKIKNNNKILNFFLMSSICALGYILYYSISTEKFFEIKYGLIPILFIIFFKSYIIPLPVINPLLCFLGKHSANIWLIHRFIRYNYCRDFIYGLEHFVIIVSVLLLLSLCISIVIEYFKKLLGYEKLIKLLLRKI